MHAFSAKAFQALPVVGILRGYPQDKVLRIAEVYAKVGFSTLEITLNTPGAIEIIAAVAAQFAGSLQVGAGTVLSLDELKAVQEAGGQFIVSPVTDIQLIQACTKQALPVFPGAYSPTEMYQAWQAGATMVKVFPARNLGPAYIKDVLAPLDQMKLMPTGGVTMDNMQAYLEAGAQAFGMGGNLFKPALIEAENWTALGDHLEAFKAHISALMP